MRFVISMPTVQAAIGVSPEVARQALAVGNSDQLLTVAADGTIPSELRQHLTDAQFKRLVEITLQYDPMGFFSCPVLGREFQFTRFELDSMRKQYADQLQLIASPSLTLEEFLRGLQDARHAVING